MAYTDIDDPSAYFQTSIYTGNGGASHAIDQAGNSTFQPDWVWIKKRSGAVNHLLHDSVRGVTNLLVTNNNDGDDSNSNIFIGFDDDGFRVGANSASNVNNGTFVGWQWKAGGSASTNSSGSTNSSVSVNTDAGFSIVSYTGAGATTYGHGLGVTPNVIIIKKRTSDSGNNNWFVYHDSVITAGSGIKTFLTLNETEPLKSNGSATTFTSISSTTFGVGTDDIISESSHTFIAYCFAEKQGYSKFGSYKGNGNADGTFVYTGFKPAWILSKRTDNSSGGEWNILDNKRDTFNVADAKIEAENNGAEETDVMYDILSNGFKIRAGDGNINASGGTYVFLAFAQNPLVTSTGVPATAR